MAVVEQARFVRLVERLLVLTLAGEALGHCERCGKSRAGISRGPEPLPGQILGVAGLSQNT